MLALDADTSFIAEHSAVTTIQIPLNDASRYNFVIRRLLLRILAVAMVLIALPALGWGADIAAIQSKLKDMGLYYGQTDGNWGDETSAAVTRYQIREGLEINGRLTEETLNSLGLAADEAPPIEEQPRGEAWRILREQDMDVLEDMPLEPESEAVLKETAPRNTVVSVPSPAMERSPNHPETSLAPPATTPAVSESSSATMSSPAAAARPQAVAVPPRAVAVPPRAVAVSHPQQNLGAITRDRLRDYIAAYVLAGLAPSVEPELEFFADKVDYFGESEVSKEVIRRDLEEYNAQYPVRRFWLAGDPQIQRETDETITVNYPLRFEVSGASGSKSGKVLKTVDLRKTGGSFEITAVDEKRAN